MKLRYNEGDKSAARRRRTCAQLVEELERRVLLAADVKFAVIGDYSSDISLKPEQDVSNLVKSWNPQLVVTVGDNNYPSGGADTIDKNVGQFYHQYMSPYSGSYGAGSADGINHFFPALGNHDYDSTGSAAPYLNYFHLPGNERYYDFQQGNVGFFILDSDPHEPDGNTSGSIQGQWLQSELAKSTAQWKLVFFHHPPYSSGPSDGDTWMRWPFQQWGATAVIAGHDHDYERLSENGFPYFVDGLGGESIFSFDIIDPGSQVRYENDYGAMLIDATTSNVTFSFTSRTGQLVDTYVVGTPTAPAAPSALTASALSGSQIKLNWADNSTNETGFKIERSTDGVNFTQVTTTAAGATTYTDSGLASANTYFYRVRATNSSGNSPYSNVASATTQNTMTLVAAGSVWKYLDNGTNQGTAWRASTFGDTTWKSGPAQLGYGDGDEATVVSYGTNASKKYITTYFRRAFTVTNPASITALNLSLLRDDGAVVYLNGTEVFRSNMPTGTISYTTLASTSIGGADESAWNPATINPKLLVSGTNVLAVEIHQSDATSSDISFDLSLSGAGVTTAPAAPANLSAVAVSATNIVLAWTDNATNETGFKIERSADGTSFGQIGATAANITSYSDSTVSGSATYYYRVRATNSVGDSAYSNIALSAPLTPPAGPTNLTATVISSTQVNLTWQDNSNNEGGFEVDRSADNLNWNQLIVTEDDVTTYSDTAVTGGTTYYYRVRAVNPAGNSGFTSTATAVVPAAAQYVYLSNLNWVSATNDQGSSWGPVEKDMSVGGSGANDGHTITLNGITYSKGLGTNAISTIVYNLGGAYSNFLCDVGIDDEEAVNGTVDFQVLADGVKIFDSGKMTATSTTQTFNLNITGVKQLTLICGDAGDGPAYDHGDWAGARLILAPTPVAPVPPTALSAVAITATQINLTWTDNSANESGFKIERSTDGTTFAPLTTTPANTSAYSDNTAKASTKYYYRVKATNSAGDSSPSNVANATTLAATAAVTYVSDLTWASATVGWGTIQKDLSIKGTPITLRGVVYAKGIGTHAASTIVYNLAGQYASFLCDIGIDDDANGQGSVDFQVLADGKLLFDATLIGTDPVISLDLPMTGVQQLTLIATNGIPNNIDYDHADWAGARLVAASGTTTALPPFNTTLPITGSSTSDTTTASSLLSTTQTTGTTTSFTTSSTMTVTSGTGA
jgi:hypothetical protein